MKFTYCDERSGDTYNVFLDFEGEFEYALRFIDKIGGSPIHYNELHEIPPQARGDIEHIIQKRKTKRDRNL